ncbi:hypothetical protein U9M48_030410 [Paspalum notatum var. saurae]|uniref:Uncharacterized protein n=1 Tax=Paspalum notatum var. saurae TaxID=547442 RepID=A0AAQ3U3J4_PASNO
MAPPSPQTRAAISSPHSATSPCSFLSALHTQQQQLLSTFLWRTSCFHGTTSLFSAIGGPLDPYVYMVVYGKMVDIAFGSRYGFIFLHDRCSGEFALDLADSASKPESESHAQ